MNKNYKTIFKSTVAFSALLAVSLALSACSGNPKKALGLDKQAPDEFMVVANPPLVLPPDFNLIPPDEITESRYMAKPQKTSSDILFKPQVDEIATKKDGYDDGTSEFLALAGAKPDDSNIRKVINKETSTLIEEEKGVTDMIMFWNDTVYDPTAVTVDAKKEQERIKNNLDSKAPVNSGETPTVKAKPKGFL